MNNRDITIEKLFEQLNERVSNLQNTIVEDWDKFHTDVARRLRPILKPRGLEYVRGVILEETALEDYMAIFELVVNKSRDDVPESLQFSVVPFLDGKLPEGATVAMAIRGGNSEIVIQKPDMEELGRLKAWLMCFEPDEWEEDDPDYEDKVEDGQKANRLVELIEQIEESVKEVTA